MIAYYRGFACTDCSKEEDAENVLCNLCYGEHLKIAREQEREACAKLLEASAKRSSQWAREILEHSAADIRARGKP